MRRHICAATAAGLVFAGIFAPAGDAAVVGVAGTDGPCEVRLTSEELSERIRVGRELTADMEANSSSWSRLLVAGYEAAFPGVKPAAEAVAGNFEVAELAKFEAMGSPLKFDDEAGWAVIEGYQNTKRAEISRLVKQSEFADVANPERVLGGYVDALLYAKYPSQAAPLVTTARDYAGQNVLTVVPYEGGKKRTPAERLLSLFLDSYSAANGISGDAAKAFKQGAMQESGAVMNSEKAKDFASYFAEAVTARDAAERICRDGSTESVRFPGNTDSTDAQSPRSEPKPDGSSLSAGALVGIVVAVLAVVGIAVGLTGVAPIAGLPVPF